MESRSQIGRKAWSNHTLRACITALALVLVIAVDRITKLYALEHFNFEHVINRFLSLELVFNRGMSFGLFGHSSRVGLIVAATFLGFCCMVLEAYKKWLKQQSFIGELLIASGTISNIIDRLLYGGVIDFILVHVGSWSWPVFNIADAAIVLGVACIIVEMFKHRHTL